MPLKVFKGKNKIGKIHLDRLVSERTVLTVSHFATVLKQLIDLALHCYITKTTLKMQSQSCKCHMINSIEMAMAIFDTVTQVKQVIWSSFKILLRFRISLQLTESVQNVEVPVVISYNCRSLISRLYYY